MIYVSAFTKDKIFPVQPKDLKLTRRYEEEEYSFVASDIKLECTDAKDIHDAVTAGEEVKFTAFQDDECKFRGIFTNEGAGFNPETEIYPFSVVHQSKQLFTAAKEIKLDDGNGNKKIQAFDSIAGDDDLRQGNLCNIALIRNDLEFWQSGSDDGVFGKFLTDNPNYSLRDFWIDFAKHYRCILFCDNNLIEGLPTLHCVPRRLYTKLHIGYDDLIADYNEENHDAQYIGVFIPCYLQLVAVGNVKTYPAFLDYTADGVTVRIASNGGGDFVLPPNIRIDNIATGSTIELQNGYLDLRCPSGLYSNVNDNHPLKGSIPRFQYYQSPGGNYWITENPLEYAQRLFYTAVHPYKDVSASYSELLAVNPHENISVNGNNVLIHEIEDDLMNEATKIIGKAFQ